MSNENKTTVLKVLIERVHSLKSGGKINEAIRTAKTAVDTARRLVQTNPDQTSNLITALELYGDLLRESDNYADAELIYIDALEKTQSSDRQKSGLILSMGLVLIRIKNTKGLSEKYKRETLADLKNQLEKIKRVIPKKHERFIEIGE